MFWFLMTRSYYRQIKRDVHTMNFLLCEGSSESGQMTSYWESWQILWYDVVNYSVNHIKAQCKHLITWFHITRNSMTWWTSKFAAVESGPWMCCQSVLSVLICPKYGLAGRLHNYGRQISSHSLFKGSGQSSAGDNTGLRPIHKD